MSEIADNVLITGPVTPGDTTDVFPSHIDIYGKGGYRTVADQTARDLITPERRSEGMLVKQLSDLTYWTLEDGIANTDWVEFTVGGGMVYPSAGIPISTGSAWGTSITDNSANWNTAYGWGNHSGLYQAVDATLTALSGLTITQGSLIYGTGADAFSVLAKGTAGQVLTMNAGATAPEWSTATGGIPTQITVANEATDAQCFPLFVTAATGNLAPKTNASFVFDSTAGYLGLGSGVVPDRPLTIKATNPIINLTDGAANQKHIQIGYDHTDNYGWIQCTYDGNYFTELRLNQFGGNVYIGSSGGSIGFFAATPVTKPTALTAALVGVVDTTYGTVEANVINNLRTRLNELETKLQALGLLS